MSYSPPMLRRGIRVTDRRFGGIDLTGGQPCDVQLDAAYQYSQDHNMMLVFPAGIYSIDGPHVWQSPGIGTTITMIGEGRGRTRLIGTATDYYDARMITSGVGMVLGTANLTFPAGTLVSGTDEGRRILVYGAGTGGSRLDTTIISINNGTNTAVLATVALTGVANSAFRLMPRALIELNGFEQFQVDGFTFEGSGPSGGRTSWCALRMGTAANSTAQRNVIRNIQAGSFQNALEWIGNRDGNNDLGLIQNAYLANYDFSGLSFYDSQQFDYEVQNLTAYGAGDWLTPVTCSITAGTNTLTTPVARFGWRHVGQIIEIVGAGPSGGVLRTTIATYVSPTQVTLAVNATATITAVAALRRGSQAGLWLGGPRMYQQGGNCAIRGAALFTTHLGSDIIDGSFNGGAVIIEGSLSSESSRAFYIQTLNGGSYRNTNIRGVRFGQGAVISEAAVLQVTAGPFTSENCWWGQPGNSSNLRIHLNATVPQFQASFRDCIITSQVDLEHVFTYIQPVNGLTWGFKPSSCDQVVVANAAGNPLTRLDRYSRVEDGRPNDQVRVEMANVAGPNLSGLATPLIIDYDPMFIPSAGTPIDRLVSNTGATVENAYRIFDRSGNNNHATTLINPINRIYLRSAGPNGRYGYRFYTSAAYMPAAAFAALTGIEVLIVLQVLGSTSTSNGGAHALGASARGGLATEANYAASIYDDTFCANRVNTAASYSSMGTGVHCLMINSNGTNLNIFYDGVSALASAGGGGLTLPTNPLIGAGASNLAGTAPSTYLDGVILRYSIFDDVLSANERAAVLSSVRSFYGTP